MRKQRTPQEIAFRYYMRTESPFLSKYSRQDRIAYAHALVGSLMGQRLCLRIASRQFVKGILNPFKP